ALYGLTDEVVSAVQPHSEADPAALLVTFPTAFGNAAGAAPHATVGGAQHPARLYVCVVGETAKSRKGVSFRDVRRIFASAAPSWTRDRIVGGLASGEGLIAHLQAQPGNALVVEEEFARTLTVASRDTSTVSQIVRQAWDDPNLRVMTRNEPLAVTDA